MSKNDSGMTLVEVLATLVLLSLVASLIWTAFFISARHNIAETTKLHLQQEANYILTKIQQTHRQKDCYKLEIKESQVRIFNCEDKPEFDEIISSNYSYLPENSEEYLKKITSEEEDLFLTLTILDPKKDSKLFVKIETTIARYRYN